MRARKPPGLHTMPYCRQGGVDFWMLELILEDGETEKDIHQALTKTDLGDWHFITWAQKPPSQIELVMAQQKGMPPKPRVAGAMIAVQGNRMENWLQRYPWEKPQLVSV